MVGAEQDNGLLPSTNGLLGGGGGRDRSLGVSD